ncbi:MAG TPA: hypothetical protein VHA82_01565 [Ramlibacter sp.]|uniref:hypothetical protein n=1 Tax=Ramlibacter sp. TaxID=1917967 RepID=UPI002CF40194|nr:hypothetical protein [Ramlibacter sp.]HVZ42469.1 hypothetical protein [Ramlibacter sp.]
MTTPNLSADAALDSSRRLASQAIDRAGDKMRELSSGMKDLAGRGMNTMSESAQLAQRRLGQYADATGRYVTEQPLKSALIAAAIGAVVAGLIIALRHSDSRAFRSRGDY